MEAAQVGDTLAGSPKPEGFLGGACQAGAGGRGLRGASGTCLPCSYRLGTAGCHTPSCSTSSAEHSGGPRAARLWSVTAAPLSSVPTISHAGHQLLVRASSSPGPHPSQDPGFLGPTPHWGSSYSPLLPLPVHPESPPGRVTGLTPRHMGSLSPRRVEWVLSCREQVGRGAVSWFNWEPGGHSPETSRTFWLLCGTPWTILARPWVLGPLSSCGPE